MPLTNFRTNPDEMARQLGVRVRTATTPPGCWGVWDKSRRLITLTPGMAPLQRTSTLWHELGHAYLGHDGRATGKQEAQADRFAARHLITFAELLSAVREDPRRSVVAQRLGVLPWVLDAYVRMLSDVQVRALRAAGKGVWAA